MSVIVRDEEGKILLLCKGADRFVINYPENSDVSLSTVIHPNSCSMQCHVWKACQEW